MNGSLKSSDNNFVTEFLDARKITLLFTLRIMAPLCSETFRKILAIDIRGDLRTFSLCVKSKFWVTVYSL